MGSATQQSLQTYQELADCYERLGQPTMRDRFLMLAADAALQLGQSDEAERLRAKLLAGSRHHMVRPYATWVEASTAPDVQAYLRDLRLNYPPDVAEQMLASLKESSDKPLDQTAPIPRSPRSEPDTLPYPAAKAEPYRHRSAIPMTAPVVDMSEPTAAPRSRTSYPMPEVYPLAAPVPAASRPATPVAAPTPPVAPAPSPSDRPQPGGSWMAAFLLVVTFLGAMAVAVYALGRPFLPASWLGL